VVSPDFFPLLGVQAQLGRVFLLEEGRPGHERVVLLGDGLWRRRFEADPAVLGRKLVMNGQSYEVVGVLPRGLRYPRDVEMWTPLVFSAEDLRPDSRGNHGLLVIARIKPGLGFEQARADMAAVSRRMVEQNPDYPYKDYNFGVIVIPLPARDRLAAGPGRRALAPGTPTADGKLDPRSGGGRRRIGAGLLGAPRADYRCRCQLPLPEQKYPKPEETRAFYRELIEHVRHLPGVDAAGGVTGLPLTGTGWSGTTTIDTQAIPEKETTPEADQRPVIPGYFEAMGIPLVRGRYFDRRDTETAALVAIVDETLANTYWPHQDPNRAADQAGRPRFHGSLARGRRGRAARALPDAGITLAGGVLLALRPDGIPSRLHEPVIHTGSVPRLLANGVRKQVQALDPDQPVYRVRTMHELMAESVARRRAATIDPVNALRQE
jgi:hypothetical protein